MVDRVREMHEKEGLEQGDLVAVFISRRVQPLQRRNHRMCDMSGHRDPTRTSTFELTREQVLDQMLAIAELKLEEGWWFGKEPYSLNRQPPKVN